MAALIFFIFIFLLFQIPQNLFASVFIKLREVSYLGRSYTVRWCNFDRRNPKMGVFLRSTEATPSGHVLKRKLSPENSPADTMFMAAMVMVVPRKIIEDFQSFLKNTKL
jgi:hypothetical protein